MARTAEVVRETKETQIRVWIDLDGTGEATVSTGIGFFDHMLDSFARHGGFDLKVETKGDLHIDMHHTVEDTGIVHRRGRQAGAGRLQGRAPVRLGLHPDGRDPVALRPGPVQPALPDLEGGVQDAQGRGSMDTELFKEFHHAFAMNAGACVHLETLYGDNSHHIAESGFKALARALRAAVELDPKTHGRAPSTKGSL
jgi:imidazoleglycerol-phosphate dehydratase